MANKRRDRRSPERTKTDKSLREERAKTDTAVKAVRKKTDKEARLPPPPAKKRADEALRGDLRADALEALLVHERAATDAYLLTERVRSDKDISHRDDFLGMVAHDVRNLLNLVVLSLAMLRPDDEEPPPNVSAAAARISRYVARMNRLIGDLVDVTSIDAGKLGVNAVEGDAASLLKEAVETFQPAALEKGISLSTEIPPGPLPAVFDRDRVLQVFANLLSNSIKFTSRDGAIEVRVDRTGGMLRFCIRDTGVGIAAPMLDAVFERFWQVGKDDRRGMGLGLYISKCIVESHGGRIWAESKVGKGSEFYFTLPVTAARPRRSTARIAEPDKTSFKRLGKARSIRSRRR